MSISVPILLALAGTALMAIAIFVPFRSSTSQRATVAAGEGVAVPDWPQLVEPTATACDARARLDLVDALASIGSPWALGVLHRASEEETDANVLAAIVSALAPAPPDIPRASGSVMVDV